jgi:putative transposase
MARFARVVAIGTAHHVTQRGVDQQRVFFTDADRNIYLDCLTKYCAQARARVLAYCLMSNHVHLVMIPEEAQSLAVAMRRTHARYALYLNARRDRTGHLWQNRFYSTALDEEHLWAALRYVERNPVRANLTGRAEEYKWSSAAAHVGTDGTGSGMLDWEFHTSAGGAERWRRLLAEPEEMLAIRRLQRGTFTGRPVGSPEFIARLEKELGRPLAARTGPGIGSKGKSKAKATGS